MGATLDPTPGVEHTEDGAFFRNSLLKPPLFTTENEKN